MDSGSKKTMYIDLKKRADARRKVKGTVSSKPELFLVDENRLNSNI